MDLEKDLYSNRWIDGIKKFTFYFEKTDDSKERRCVNAVAPLYAVTYCHGSNKTLEQRNSYGPGTKFLVHACFTNRRIPVEVVYKSGPSDFVVLEAIEGKFYDGSVNERNLDSALKGDPVMMWGLSNQLRFSVPAEPAFHRGTIMGRETDKCGRMIADLITWPADSGGGLYNKNGKLVGIVSSSWSPLNEENNFTRTKFVEGDTIDAALNWLLDLNLNEPAPHHED